MSFLICYYFSFKGVGVWGKLEWIRCSNVAGARPFVLTAVFGSEIACEIQYCVLADWWWEAELSRKQEVVGGSVGFPRWIHHSSNFDYN